MDAIVCADPTPSLRQVVRRTLILAYTENVQQLNRSLTDEGLRPEIIRASYTPEELAYSRAFRTLLNHRAAWLKAADSEGYTLICEADFVPCRRLGEFPVFWPCDDGTAWGYLYQCSPRLLSLVGDAPFLRANSSSLVGYVVNSRVADLMLRFYEDELSRHEIGSYWAFDVHLPWYLMSLGGPAYMPARNYGEHGGLPNVEHARIGKLPHAGMHRADSLMGQLSFLPQYARGSYARFVWERAKGKAVGWGRLFAGRWIFETEAYDLSFADKVKMLWIGARRLI